VFRDASRLACRKTVLLSEVHKLRLTGEHVSGQSQFACPALPAQTLRATKMSSPGYFEPKGLLSKSAYTFSTSYPERAKRCSAS
jgi:hypothetical protein